MTTMAATLIYGKNPFIFYSPEIKVQWHWGLVCSIGNMGSITFEKKNDNLGLTLTFYTRRSNFVGSYRQNLKKISFTEIRRPRPLIFIRNFFLWTSTKIDKL